MVEGERNLLERERRSRERERVERKLVIENSA